MTAAAETIERPQARAPLPAIVSGSRPLAIVPTDLDQVARVATMIHKSGFAPFGMDTIEKVGVALMHGLEIGLPPMQAIQKIAVINGRPAVWGDAVPGIALGTGQLEDWSEEFIGDGDQMVAVCRVKRKGIKTPKEATFSVADAKRAKLWDDRARVKKRNKRTNEWYDADNDSPWYKYQKRMLQMRARVAFRDLFADAFSGLYIAEELITGELSEEEVNAKDVTPRTRKPLPAPVEPVVESPAIAEAVADDASEQEEPQANQTEATAEPPKRPLPPLAKVAQARNEPTPQAAPVVSDFPGDTPMPPANDDGLDIPLTLRRSPEPPKDEPVDVAQWLSDLGGALNGCEDITSLAEVQSKVQKPMEKKVSKADYARGQTLVMDAFNRISNSDDGDGE